MKKINNLIVFGLLFMTSWGCKKLEDITVINPSAALVATLSTPTAVLLKDNAAKDAFTVQWATPSYGFDAAPSYTIYIDKKGGNFSKPTVYAVGSDLSKTFKTLDFNNVILGMVYFNLTKSAVIKYVPAATVIFAPAAAKLPPVPP